ncbi:MAG: hypothetical protein JNK48_22255 [Bryobacterales bacterium]|nr:hypothetical protein [Bryobacterales bacterium]
MQVHRPGRNGNWFDQPAKTDGLNGEGVWTRRELCEETVYRFEAPPRWIGERYVASAYGSTEGVDNRYP